MSLGHVHIFPCYTTPDSLHAFAPTQLTVGVMKATVKLDQRTLSPCLPVSYDLKFTQLSRLRWQLQAE